MTTPILGRAPPLAGFPKFAWASSLVQRLKTRSAPKVTIRWLSAAEACPTARPAVAGTQILKYRVWLSAAATRCGLVHLHICLCSCMIGSFAAFKPALTPETFS